MGGNSATLEAANVIVLTLFEGADPVAREALKPSLFANLVYVAAFAPVTGVPAGDYMASPENEGSLALSLLVADPAVAGAVRIDPGDRSRHAQLCEAFYGDLDDATATAAISLLGADAPVGIPTETFAVSPERYGTVPHTYIVCTKDNMVPEALQRRFVDEIDAISLKPTTVFEFDSSHSPFLSQPAKLAATLADAFATDRCD